MFENRGNTVFKTKTTQSQISQNKNKKETVWEWSVGCCVTETRRTPWHVVLYVAGSIKGTEATQ